MRHIPTPPDWSGAPLAELKHWLAITTMGEDALLARLIGAAADLCERFTGCLPIETDMVEVLPASAEWQGFASRPVQAVTGLDGLPAEGPQFPLPADAFAIELDADGGARMRVLRPGAAGRVAARLTVGVAPDWAALPDGLRHGIVRLAAHLYLAREPGQPDRPPAAVAALWAPYRRMRLA